MPVPIRGMRLRLIIELKKQSISNRGMLNRVPEIVLDNLFYRGGGAHGLIYEKGVDHVSIAFQISE